MKALSLITSAALLASAFAPNAMADGRNPGSLLVYPVHRSGGMMFTIACVTNTNTAPATPVSFGGSTNLHYEYVNVAANPANPFKPLSCVIFDRIEFLTPADTLCVLTSCHNAVAPGGQEGYLVISAEDPSLFRTPFSHNFLIGSEMVVNASGAVYSINAVPFEAIPATGAPTDINANGRLNLNDVEYESAPDTVYIDSYVALASSQLALVNLRGGQLECNDLYLSVWNDNERALSATLRFNCWFDQPLTSVSPLFSEAFLASVPNDPAELDINCDGIGDIETGWACIDSRGVFDAAGQPVAAGAPVLGAITAGPGTTINGGRLLWESVSRENGVFFRP